MYIDDNYSLSDNVYQGDKNLGFSLNPIKNIQQVAQQVQAVVAKVAPPIVAKLSPTNIIAQQANAVAKIDTQAKALAVRAAQAKAKTIYAATAASPLGKKLVTPMLDVGAVKSPIGKQLMPSVLDNMNAWKVQADKAQAERDAQEKLYIQQQNDAAKAQAAADAAAQAAYDKQMMDLYVQQQAAWEANQRLLTPGSSWSAGTSQTDPIMTTDMPSSNVDYSTSDTSILPIDASLTTPVPSSVAHWYDWWLQPIKPWGGQAVAVPVSTPVTTQLIDNTPVPAWDPYSLSTDNTGDNMQLSNIPSRRSLSSGTFKQSGLGDIWGDLMTTATTMYGQKTAAQIQQSQAAQADAAARIAAANAAAIEAQKNASAVNMPLMLTVAAAGAGAWFFLKRKKHA